MYNRIDNLRKLGVKDVTLIFDGESPASKAATRAKRKRYVSLARVQVAGRATGLNLKLPSRADFNLQRSSRCRRASGTGSAAGAARRRPDQ